MTLRHPQKPGFMPEKVLATHQPQTVAQAPPAGLLRRGRHQEMPEADGTKPTSQSERCKLRARMGCLGEATNTNVSKDPARTR